MARGAHPHFLRNPLQLIRLLGVRCTFNLGRILQQGKHTLFLWIRAYVSYMSSFDNLECMLRGFLRRRQQPVDHDSSLSRRFINSRDDNMGHHSLFSKKRKHVRPQVLGGSPKFLHILQRDFRILDVPLRRGCDAYKLFGHIRFKYYSNPFKLLTEKEILEGGNNLEMLVLERLDAKRRNQRQRRSDVRDEDYDHYYENEDEEDNKEDDSKNRQRYEDPEFA
eukprot:CAMPEP_0185251290 /NCGR_PEP_ID=MMETSP1359-20130426/703_1 /TAXON_ID=552665 /ORGANISM="Bigelowiella longifila, Strain CCMP242" /LENGTH=221 /DNA_ID=CAMNT_0027833111 /DNA_START=286 /DNA_END=952 /DNA_ORIENTATION=+